MKGTPPNLLKKTFFVYFLGELKALHSHRFPQTLRIHLKALRTVTIAYMMENMWEREELAQHLTVQIAE